MCYNRSGLLFPFTYSIGMPIPFFIFPVYFLKQRRIPMLWPKKLLPGDTIGLVCPCSPILPEAVALCEEAIRSRGFRVKIAGNLSLPHGGYMAGSGRERADWLNRMFADPEVDAIFCVRGGDGGTRVVPYLDLDCIRANPKPLVGYSDVTTLHLLLNQDCGLVSFHGPMVFSNLLNIDPFSEQALWDCLNGDGCYCFRNPPAEPIRVLKPGRATGTLIGGNLSLLSAAMGTSYAPRPEGKILFIEEVEEPVTKIEKWMCQLKNAGIFRRCNGVLLGQFTSIHNRFDPDFTELDCIRELLEDEEIPVLYNLQSGHGDYMVTLPFGAQCTMDTEDCSIRFHITRR